MIDYQRIARAIQYIKEHSAEQPNLDDIAKAIHLSPYHFHRLFREWAGVTPKDFLRFISLTHAKKMLKKYQTIEEATFHTGLSSTSRLHDLFVNMVGMTPGEFKNGGRGLNIEYHFSTTRFGNILIASTGKGICNLIFSDDKKTDLEHLRKTWYNAVVAEGTDSHIENLKKIFNRDWSDLEEIKLHIRGSEFQLKVWEALLRIPFGKLTSYSEIAKEIDNPKAFRAVGSAIGNNPVAYLIPCHRVIKKAGVLGQYRWGTTRKTAIIGWEAAQTEVNIND